jgi:hypothetical protein
MAAAAAWDCNPQIGFDFTPLLVGQFVGFRLAVNNPCEKKLLPSSNPARAPLSGVGAGQLIMLEGTALAVPLQALASCYLLR